MPPPADASLHPLCTSGDLVNAGPAVPFDVVFGGQTCRAFAIRFEGQTHAYLNRCAHVAMEMDWQPNRFFDDTGRWLICASHGATSTSPTPALALAGPAGAGWSRLIWWSRVAWCTGVHNTTCTLWTFENTPPHDRTHLWPFLQFRSPHRGGGELGARHH